MVIDKYKVLLTVINEKSFSVAAELIGYSPSGISRMINSLEEEVGVPLLDRHRRVVTPTRECIALLPTINKAIEVEERLKRQAESLARKETGILKVGIAYSCFHSCIFECIHIFHEIHPGFNIQLFHQISSPLADMIRNSTIDIAIMSRRPGTFSWIPILEDPLEIFYPMEWKDRLVQNDGSISISHVESENYIEMYPEQESDNTIYMKEHNIQPNVQFTTDRCIAAFDFAAKGFGLTMNNRINSYNLSPLTYETCPVSSAPVSPAQKIEIGIAIRDQLSDIQLEFANILQAKIKEKYRR